MPLNDAQFLAKVEALQEDMEKETDRITARKLYAIKLLTLMKEYLTSATITITGTSNQGAFTGTGKIS